ncbi:hypothetical protein BYT27DRAFT_7341708 [Phlegmacium glaucopus]|nr:hypothetical protein BYT27DRAFT_7341708 [Phlegmacium glaucopus]
MSDDNYPIPFAIQEEILTHHARSLIERHISRLESAQKLSGSGKNDAAAAKLKVPVGILGAGLSGLYTALILQSIGIACDVFDSSKEVGGRINTHKFPDKAEKPSDPPHADHEAGDYDYYDVGASCFPLPKKTDGAYNSGVTARLAHLISYLSLDGDGGKLLPYYPFSKGNPAVEYFNGVSGYVDSTGKSRPTYQEPTSGVSAEFIEVGVPALVDDVIAPFARMLVNDIVKGGDTRSDDGWRYMMYNDAYSVRGYMATKYLPNSNFGLPPAHIPMSVVNWCETHDEGTGHYDRALSERVLESIISRPSSEDVDWMCLGGGMHILPDAMKKQLDSDKKTKVNFKMGSPITKVGLTNKDAPLAVERGSTVNNYSHVISTLPLPILRTIDLTDSKLSIDQNKSLRELAYSPAVKIAIRFDQAWWTLKESLNIVGGQSFTDLPLRNIIYPSYGVDDSRPSETLVASYCWTSDAERLGALINTNQKTWDDQLREVVLRDLALVHGIEYKFLKEHYVDMHAFDWGHNPESMGGFPLFGPGEFETLYTSMTVPAADGRLFFAGDAISVRHSSMVGALDSAWAAVHSLLIYAGTKEQLKDFYDKWGKNGEWFQGVSAGKDESKIVNLHKRHLELAGL